MSQNNEEAKEPMKIGESYNDRDQELINELIKSRLSQKEELEYDPLEDYEVPPRTQFSMLSKPAVVIKRGQMTFSSSCIRLFTGVTHILPMLSVKRQRLCIVPLTEEEPSSVIWAKKKDNKWSNRPITSNEFIQNLFALMHWNPHYRYKVLGHVANSPQGLVLVFDMSDAIFYTGRKKEVVDEITGAVKKKQDVFFPKQYKNRIGTPYSDYMTRHQMNQYEDLSDMILPIKTYDDAPDYEQPDEEPQISTIKSEVTDEP